MKHSPGTEVGTAIACALLAAGCVVFVSCKGNASGDHPAAAAQATGSPTSEIQEQVEKQQAGMKALLRKAVGTYAANPDSLQFKDEVLYHQGGPEIRDGQLAWPSGWVLCGKVNGESSSGVYTGFRAFVAIVTIRPDERGSMSLSSLPMYEESDDMSGNRLKQFCHTNEQVE